MPPMTVMATTSMLAPTGKAAVPMTRERVAVDRAADAGDEAGEDEALQLDDRRAGTVNARALSSLSRTRDEQPAEPPRRTLRAEPQTRATRTTRTKK